VARKVVSVFFGRNAKGGGRRIAASSSDNGRSGEITVQVTINYFAQVRQAAGGVESERLSLDDGVDIQTALSELAGRHGDAFRALVLDQAGAVRPGLLTLVNGQSVPNQQRHPLADGDELSLISAVAGG
jgi:molybdopterin converting factor small subunit